MSNFVSIVKLHFSLRNKFEFFYLLLVFFSCNNLAKEFI